MFGLKQLRRDVDYQASQIQALALKLDALGDALKMKSTFENPVVPSRWMWVWKKMGRRK